MLMTDRLDSWRTRGDRNNAVNEGLLQEEAAEIAKSALSLGDGLVIYVVASPDRH